MVKRERVANATVKLWKKIGDAFADWADDVGAQEMAREATEKFYEGVETAVDNALEFTEAASQRARGAQRASGRKKVAGKKKTAGKKKGTVTLS